MNTFHLAGYLGADLKLKTKDETSWTQLRVATNNGRSTQWFWITAFGKLAETMVKKLVKGDGIAIRGELRVNSYNGAERVRLARDLLQDPLIPPGGLPARVWVWRAFRA